MARIGLLGGSFNPAHRGHRHISLEAIRALDLDEIWWLVSPGNPLKEGALDMAPFEARLGSAFQMARGQRILVSDFDHGLFIVSLTNPPTGQNLMTPAVATHPVNQTLRAAQARPLLREALHRWQAAGVDTSSLGTIDVRIADLGGLTLGKAAGGVIWLDDNAAGWGWFVDATPRNDSEFSRPG
ncbi:MAG: hypothetical protein ACJ8F4_03550, partial [Sphingomonas sp.]